MKFRSFTFKTIIWTTKSKINYESTTTRTHKQLCFIKTSASSKKVTILVTICTLYWKKTLETPKSLNKIFLKYIFVNLVLVYCITQIWNKSALQHQLPQSSLYCKLLTVNYMSQGQDRLSDSHNMVMIDNLKINLMKLLCNDFFQ